MRKLLVLIFSLSLFSVTQQAAAEEKNKTVDVVLIGGGIMSATLGTYLHELEPTWTIDMARWAPRCWPPLSNAAGSFAGSTAASCS